MAAGTGSLASLCLYEMLETEETGAFTTSGGMGIREAMWLVEQKKEKNVRPVIRPEIRNNPRAVFLIETHVDAQKDASGHFTGAVEQLNSEGKGIAQRIFVKGSGRGGVTFIKPNFTSVPEHCYNRTTGVYASPDFIAGMAEHLYDLDNTNVIAGESPIPASNHRLGGIYDALDPIDLPFIEAGYQWFTHYEKDEINWLNTNKSIVWKKIPYIRPVGDDDCMLINIATLKCHLTALTTLSVKNLQGLVPKGYGQLCWPAVHVEQNAERDGFDYKKHFHKDFFQRVEASFLRHSASGFKRWEDNTEQFGSYQRFEELGGYEAFKKAKKDREMMRGFLNEVGSLMRQEMWIQRGLDNADTIKPDLNIIEGIIGLDGNEHDWGKVGEDQLVNMVVVGCSPYEVDAVGNYIMGHDPREIWYTRVAKERGLGECDINKIDVNRIRENGDIEPVKNLSEIKRHPLGISWTMNMSGDGSRISSAGEEASPKLFW